MPTKQNFLFVVILSVLAGLSTYLWIGREADLARLEVQAKKIADTPFGEVSEITINGCRFIVLHNGLNAKSLAPKDCGCK